MNKIKIIQQHYVLHFDEYPILFIGKNYKSEVVIGSFMFENEDDDTLQFFHSIVKNEQAVLFLQQKISYLEILQKAVSIHILKKDFNDTILQATETTFNNIDKDCLPLPQAFCPKVSDKIISKFTNSNSKQVKATSIVLYNKTIKGITKQNKSDSNYKFNPNTNIENSLSQPTYHKQFKQQSSR